VPGKPAAGYVKVDMKAAMFVRPFISAFYSFQRMTDNYQQLKFHMFIRKLF